MGQGLTTSIIVSQPTLGTGETARQCNTHFANYYSYTNAGHVLYTHLQPIGHVHVYYAALHVQQKTYCFYMFLILTVKGQSLH